MKIKILLGPVCSGKTSYARYLQEKYGYIRISFDDLRIMFFNKLTNEKAADKFICDVIDSAIMSSVPDYVDKIRIVIDGYPLNLERIGSIMQRWDVDILLFQIDLYTANIRNRKRRREEGIFIEPAEIRRYNDLYEKFVNSDEFKHKAYVTKVPINLMKNQEVRSADNNCLVM